MRLISLPAFEDNYIWALQNGADAIVVDPGDAGPVLALAGQGLQPIAVLITHHHLDHCGGVAALRERWPSLPVFAPHDDRFDFHFSTVGDGLRVAVGGWHFDVIGVPGHTLSHIAFVDEHHLFSGDTLFSLGCGRLFEGTPAQMYESLQKLARLPSHLQVCCGHESTLTNAAFALVVDPDNAALSARAEEARRLRAEGRSTLPVALASEQECNPFLRCDTAAVRNAISNRLGRTPADTIETFAELRRWKDEFRV
ncbi:MAG: hydroxyacylglutathione hydrolase [Xanthomonadaceae bacterium]|jgi:hydroxyacylglutathione hydrolase|nr:hydroxyacylglutathione hydrolase [Xanthomonadaceae bacterium]